MIFGIQDYDDLARHFSSQLALPRAAFAMERYDNGELHVILSNDVQGQVCFLLGTIAPPEGNLASFTLLAHTLKTQGATYLVGVLPYLSYTRQDKLKPRESLATAWAGNLLRASGIDQILTVDLHSRRDIELFPLPINSLSPARLLATAIADYGLTDGTIVAPDHGAITRCDEVKRALGAESGATPYFEKERTAKGVVHGRLVGEVTPRVLLIDDILDTGGTLVSACERLLQHGVREIYVCVTHGLFTGTRWKRLWSQGVKKIFCTDTIPQTARAGEDIEVISVKPLIVDAIANLVRSKPEPLTKLPTTLFAD